MVVISLRTFVNGWDSSLTPLNLHLDSNEPRSLIYAFGQQLTVDISLECNGFPHIFAGISISTNPNATWNYPGMPHHHGVHGIIQLNWTLQQGNFGASTLNTLSYILESPRVSEF
jgi:hypothetical protein